MEATPLAEIYLKKKSDHRSIITDEYSQIDNYQSNDFQLSQKLRPGSIVVHDVFGKGKVVYLDGYGENQKVIVEFKSGIKKHLMVKYANLKIIK
jgi:DNA helicase-2/ATP-dependent DNA helicase PcrA